MMIRILRALFLIFTALPVRAEMPVTATEPLLKAAIHIAKQVMRANEEESDFAVVPRLSFLTEAYAGESHYDCFYGGWPSHWVTRGGHRYCQNPKKLPNYQHGKCKSNELACQPLIFGPGNCVEIKTQEQRRTTFSRCEAKFKKRGSPLRYLEKVNLEDPEKITDYLNAVSDVCKDKSFRSTHLTICSRLEQKVAQISVYLRKKREPSPLLERESSSSCLNCEVPPERNPAPNVTPAITQIKTAMESDDPDVLYRKIKENYLASGECHRYSYLPKADQDAFRIKLYRKEIESIRPPEGSEAFTDLGALNVIAEEMGLSDEAANPPRDELRALPKKGDENYEGKRVAFQSKLISMMRSKLNDPTFSTSISDRTAALFSKLGIEEDCDFISQEAFKDAYLAHSKASAGLKKKDLLTVIDRSMPKNGRRMITLDLSSKKVLYHSVAGFGDGDHNDQALSFDEANYCSNKAGSNATPVGGGVTTVTRTSSSFPGRGTFLKTPGESGGLQDRGIAIHSLIRGSDMFTGYAPDENQEDRPGDQLNRSIQSPSGRAIDLFLWKTIAVSPDPGPTNGCIGLPSDRLDGIQKMLEGGSFVYFYCPKDMVK